MPAHVVGRSPAWSPMPTKTRVRTRRERGASQADAGLLDCRQKFLDFPELAVMLTVVGAQKVIGVLRVRPPRLKAGPGRDDGSQVRLGGGARLPAIFGEHTAMRASPNNAEQLLARAAQGDVTAVSELLGAYRDRLRKMVTSRLDARLVARLDPSDVVQETFIVAAGNLPRYAREQPLPFYPWLRRLALQRLIDLQRKHLYAERRSVLREAVQPALNDSTIHELARYLLARAPGPHSEYVAAEREAGLRKALSCLEEMQREVLLLHYVEDLSLAETAQVLQITADAARMRHFRALKQLRKLLAEELRE